MILTGVFEFFKDFFPERNELTPLLRIIRLQLRAQNRNCLGRGTLYMEAKTLTCPACSS